eukprot:scaffold2177_cov272-Pinguiococcus_pyrenoidosus.AAC.6
MATQTLTAEGPKRGHYLKGKTFTKGLEQTCGSSLEREPSADAAIQQRHLPQASAPEGEDKSEISITWVRYPFRKTCS